MNHSSPFGGNFRRWLSPLVHLSNNWISLVGVVIVTTATVFWLFLLPVTMGGGETNNPYFGIAVFLILPGLFFLGLALIPLGIWLRFRIEGKRGSYPSNFPPLDLRSSRLRRLLWFVGLTTLVNLVIASQTSYEAVNYMDSVTFCGQTCHTVMQPEFTAYQNSPHSRVECVKCHIGPGASWFVRSKLSGTGQVFAVAFNSYPRPIPTPVENLRPARDTCESCHWPEKWGGNRLRVLDKFAEDEANTHTKTVLMMRIGGAGHAAGIHGKHFGPGVVVRYAHRDKARQDIPWVEYADSTGKRTVYLAPDTKPEVVKDLEIRTMDCVDCHNRPTHIYDLPERAMDHALAEGEVSPSLPFVKKTAVELLRKSYATRDEASKAIPAGLERFYRENHPDVYAGRRAEITRSAQGVLDIYRRNIFPEMKVTWGTYINNIGHTDFPGCFRCHDDAHKSSEGPTISQDCSSCHELLAMEEESPKILTDLGVAPPSPASGTQ